MRRGRGGRGRQRRSGRLLADWHVVGSTAGMKILVMGLSGVLGIVTSRLIIQNYGVENYAQYGLLASLPTLLPFADLGIAAVVINTVAGSVKPDEDEDVRRTLTSALRVLVFSGAIIVGLSLALLLLGWWPALLGGGLLPGGDVVATVCLVLFGLTLPLSIGARVLVGMNRNPSQVGVQAVIAPLILLCVGGTVVLGIGAGGALAIFSYFAAMVSAVLCLVLAGRAVSPQLTRAIRAVPHLRRDPGVRIRDTAWPMLVQMIALPIAMQTDRILISHRSDSQTLAQYNLAFQLFGIVLQTISAAGVALWPLYAKSRALGHIRSPARPAAVFLVGGLLLASIMAILSPWLARLVSGGVIRLDGWLLGGFIAFVAVQAVKYPLGMYMTDRRGLRAQVIPTLLMVPMSVGLSWWLISPIGAAGPVIGSAAAVAVCQILPMSWFVHRDLRARRLESVEATVR
ncbi:MAG: oligosaccharide flippase family protein [Kineosporiaceae bacterium]|nr:oligosaccharide flippase family protein [Aeromicrobium sp.]